MKPIYHKFSGGMPILFVENLSDFGDNILRLESYCNVVKFKNSPLKFMLFETQSLKEDFGEKSDHVVDAVLALYAGHTKYPHNTKLCYNHAIKMTIKEGLKDAYDILNELHRKEFKKNSEYEFYND